MTWFLLISICLLFVIFDVASFKVAKRSVTAECSLQTELTEPDVEFSLNVKVTNKGIFPVLFCRVSVAFPAGVLLSEGNNSVSSVLSAPVVVNNVQLKPRSMCSYEIKLRVPARGIWHFGNCYVTTGDFAGFKSYTQKYDSRAYIVCTAGKTAYDVGKCISGANSGNISVYRFLYDDPTLVAGYREYSGREPLKQISWLQTAKLGIPFVKQNDFTIEPSVRIVLDVSGGTTDSKEEAFRKLRAVCEFFEKKRIEYSVCSNTTIQCPKPGYGQAHLNRVLMSIGCAPCAVVDNKLRLIREGENTLLIEAL